MTEPKFDFDDADSGSPDVAGTPEGDGDFETDNLPIPVKPVPAAKCCRKEKMKGSLTLKLTPIQPGC